MAELVPSNDNDLSFRPGGCEGFYNMLNDFFGDIWSPGES